MVTQYPHTITITSVSGNDKDISGNWQKGSASTFQYSGRFETNSGSNFLTAADGRQVQYSGIIYSSYATPNINIGASVEVVDESGGPKAKGKVIQFSRGQLNARVWIE